jgi:hypothetical protein
MEGGNSHGVRRRLAFAGRRLVLVFVCLVLAPIGGIWVGAQLPNPPGNGPGVWQIVFGLGVPAGVALVAVAATQVRGLKRLFGLSPRSSALSDYCCSSRTSSLKSTEAFPTVDTSRSAAQASSQGADNHSDRSAFRSIVPIEKRRLAGKVEAAGIEPASSGSDDSSRPEGNPDDSEAGRLASDDSHEVERSDDDPRSQRGPSIEAATTPEVAGDEPPS